MSKRSNQVVQDGDDICFVLGDFKGQYILSYLYKGKQMVYSARQNVAVGMWYIQEHLTDVSFYAADIVVPGYRMDYSQADGSNLDICKCGFFKSSNFKRCPICTVNVTARKRKIAKRVIRAYKKHLAERRTQKQAAEQKAKAREYAHKLEQEAKAAQAEYAGRNIWQRLFGLRVVGAKQPALAAEPEYQLELF